MHSEERRTSRRFGLDLTGCAIINGKNVALKTHDLSLQGALVEFAPTTSLEIGTALRILLNIGFIARASVCRIDTLNDGILYGLRFTRFDCHSDLLLSAYFVQLESQLPATPSVQ